MAYNSDLLRAIRAESTRTGVPARVLVATTLAESGGNIRASGDGGHSGGAWQENDWGRGAGIPMAQRWNPYASTRRAATEFSTFMRRGGYSSLGQLAANAQRPADRVGYARRINGLLDDADSILGGVTPVAREQLGPSLGSLGATGATGGDDRARLGMAAMTGRREGESFTGAVGRELASGLYNLSAIRAGSRNSSSLGSRVLADGPPVGAVNPRGSGAADAAVVTFAKKFLGTPYSWGGGGPSGPSLGFGRGAGTKGFDCSSLIQYAYAQIGVKVPRTTYGQIKAGSAVRHLSDVQPGDLLFPSTGHVQMYIGNGQVIHSPKTGDVVRVASLGKSFIAIRRPGG